MTAEYTKSINIFLLAAIVAFAFYYIIGANGLASVNYEVKILNDKLIQLDEEQAALLAQKAGIEETLITHEFARSHNMVEAKNISYIFEKSNVAQR